MTEEPLAELDAIALLEAAQRAGVSVTVDCQCPGVFINGRHDSGSMGRPEGVPDDLLEALTTRAGELEPLLTEAGWFSCGCERKWDLEDMTDDDGEITYKFADFQSTN
jgi:hypothetical protein